MQKIDIKVKKLNTNAIVPTYGTEFAAGADLYACCKEPIEIKPHETQKISTGIAFEMPEGVVGLVYARSSLGCKKGLAPANKVGVVDSDYRGEVMVFLHNHSTETKKIENGERVAQIVFAPYFKGVFEEVDKLNESVRGEGGFGSTGKF
ncbi:MAG: dUTP diphosphatase [Candidatus Caccovivens sp.]